MKEGKKKYFLIKDFNTLVCAHTLHHGRKQFYYYCLQAFSRAELLKSQGNDCFKINVEQMIRYLKDTNM